MQEHKDSNSNEQVVRLDDILYILLKHHKTLIGLALIGLMVGVLVSFAFYVRGLTTVEYYVTASIAVTSTNENGLFSANSSDPNATDIHLAEDMTKSVIYVCKSDITLNAAAEKLQLIGVTAENIKPKLMLSQYEETQIIEMTLVWDNAEEGMLILNAITEVVPDILIDTLKIGDVTIVNPPKVKPASLSFINTKIVAICFLLGAMIGAAFYLVRHFVHPTFLHSEDSKESFNLDVLGEIPRDKNYFNKKVNTFSANDFSNIQEYFSACAHVLVYRLQDIDNVCVYLTSSAPQEGKSSITASLGYALADLGYKTLLMDMDVRNPSLGSKFVFDKDEKHSLNAVYRGEIDVFDAIVKINSNLDILPTRLENERVRLDNNVVEIISSAKSEYDFVLIDTAPVGQVSDSLSLNQAADCAIFVIRQDQVWLNTISESISRLRKSGIAILGSIVNDTNGGSISYYHSSYNQFKDSPYYRDMKPSKKSKSKKSDASFIDMNHSNNKHHSSESDSEEDKIVKTSEEELDSFNEIAQKIVNARKSKENIKNKHDKKQESEKADASGSEDLKTEDISETEEISESAEETNE